MRARDIGHDWKRKRGGPRRRLVDGAAVKDVARGQNDGVRHDREHDRVAEVLRRSSISDLSISASDGSMRADAFSVSSELRRCATWGGRSTGLHRLARLAEEARRARVHVGHVDLLVLAPEALDVGELEAEREQRGEVLSRFSGGASLGGSSSTAGLCLVAHGFGASEARLGGGPAARRRCERARALAARRNRKRGERLQRHRTRKPNNSAATELTEIVIFAGKCAGAAHLTCSARPPCGLSGHSARPSLKPLGAASLRPLSAATTATKQRRFPQASRPSRPTSTSCDPLWNKGMAFDYPERDRLNVRGLIPPMVKDIDDQARRFLLQMRDPTVPTCRRT